LAEPIRLASDLDAADMLRALLGSPAFDTGTIACLAGQWLEGETLIGWQPRRITNRLDELTPTEGDSERASQERQRRGAQRARSRAESTEGDSERASQERQRVRSRAESTDGRWIGRIDYRGGCWFGLFDTLLRQDRAGHWWFSGDPALAVAIEQLPRPAAGRLALTGITATSRDDHLAAVEQAILQIRAGQLYQVNVCARLAGTITGEPAELFARGVRQLAPDYAAFLQTPERTAVSLSPELFLRRRGASVCSAPIKGTRPRAGNQPDDPGAHELRRSAKDRAENVMIVDLVRNDLSRVCRPGTVAVGELLGVRAAPGVWHLVSEVTGQLTATAGTAELLAATFPPGSVTGAPKIRACRLIDELEPAERGLFTGAIGHVRADACEFSVAIRTFEITGNRFELGVGGGITADSVPLAEWRECQVKAAPLLALAGAGWPEPAGPDRSDVEWADRGEGIFETLLCRDGRLVAAADHLARLEASCLELYGTALPSGLADRLAGTGRQLSGRHRIRLTLCPPAEPVIEVEQAPEPGGRLALRRAHRPAGNWRHKWADRRWLGNAEQAGAAALFSGADGGVAETGTANIVLVPAEGVLRTPALSADLLPGVTRRRFLDAAVDHGWRIELGRIEFAELPTARLVIALSSLRELVFVDRLDGIGIEVDHRLAELVSGWLG
jgi:para-aminobenzoate synthetase/4-amino-4-deoxychorismate lyase